MSERFVVVTGASTGIGRTTALGLDREGYRVFAGVRRAQDADTLKADASPRLTPLSLDVTDAASREAAVRRVAEAAGGEGLHGLVNNAGIVVASPVEFLDLGALRRQLEVNVVGLVAVTQAFLPLLRAARGRIVHIGSSSGYIAAPLMAPYSASKYAVEAIADAMRRELAGSGVAVSLVEPGAIATPIWDKGVEMGDELVRTLPPQAIDFYGERIERLRAYARKAPAQAIPPERVAEAVRHALAAPRPRTRYRVGADARSGWWLSRLLPDRAMDWLLERLTQA
ncbi:MAG TPA: SDR family oxidoreductase [Myxococcota bacterium]|nr:SDR family oxidoreductase [Myxococcota bacterium]